MACAVSRNSLSAELKSGSRGRANLASAERRSNMGGGKGVPMPGETELHTTLKKEACRWLYRMGYRCIAAEVRLKPLGIIDAVGTGLFKPFHNYLFQPRELPQVCFIECKASRADFLRDQSNDGQMTLCMLERKRNLRSKRRKTKRGR